MHRLNNQAVEKNCAGVAWFGQNSFAIKSHGGTVVLTDPYFPAHRPGDKFFHPVVPEGVFGLAPDFILLTHDHSDHTDVETIHKYLEAYPALKVIGPRESIAHLGTGDVIAAGQTVTMGDMAVTALYSKVPQEGMITHLGYVIKTGDGVKVYVSGDTQNDLARNDFLLDPIIRENPHIGLITTHPTEGEFPFFEDTAVLAQKADMRFAVPAHYGCFSKRSFDPFAWQRVFPLHGAMPVIIPYNGYAQFSAAEKTVTYGYSQEEHAPSCCKTAWCGQDVYKLQNGALEAMLDPRWGGSLFRLTDTQKGCEILHTPVNHETYSGRNRIYGIPVILPPNRIRDGEFQTETRKYDMVINSPDGHHCHGLMSQYPWTVEDFGIDKEGNPFIVVSCVNDESFEFYKSFPHRFKVTSKYILQKDALRHELSCVNQSAEPMPFGIGCHISFNAPFYMASRGENVLIQLPVDKRWELDGVSIPTGYQAPLMSIEDGYRGEGIPAQGQAIRDHYSGKPLEIKGEAINGPVLHDKAAGLSIVYQTGDSFRHWMIWNEDGQSGFICPEPMTWAIDAPNLALPREATGYKELAPGQAWADFSTIQVRKDERK